MFKGPGGMGDMMGLMKQAQKMKKDMKKLKKEISKTNITVTNDDNSISLVISGDHLVQKITISESIFKLGITYSTITAKTISSFIFCLSLFSFMLTLVICMNGMYFATCSSILCLTRLFTFSRGSNKK